MYPTSSNEVEKKLRVKIKLSKQEKESIYRQIHMPRMHKGDNLIFIPLDKETFKEVEKMLKGENK